MDAFSSTLKAGLRGAGLTALTLFGGMLLGVAGGFILFETLPGHMSDPGKIAAAALPALLGVFLGGALWGRAFSASLGYDNSRRQMIAGALGFGLSVILAQIVLTILEVQLVERGGGPGWPIHVTFLVIFPPAAAFVAASGGFVLAAALENRPTGLRAAATCGVAAGAAFLIVGLLMDGLGWRVGAPGAAARFTMLTVLALGSLASALAGGAALAAFLDRRANGVQS
jgi:hypothetical protein